MDMEEKPKYGQPKEFDPDFKGPIQNRGCTDIICCIFFIVAIVGYVAVGILAWTHGDPRKVIYPTDSLGQYCGQGKLEKQPLLFYFNMMKCASPMVLLEFQCPTPQVCVEKCPDRTLTLVTAIGNTQDWEYYKSYCRADPGTKPVVDILQKKLCPAYLISSKPFLQRCFPSLGKKGDVITVGDQETFNDGDKMRDAKDLVAGMKNATIVMEGRQVAMKIFEDYTKSWYWILICLLVAVVLSLIFIVLLRYLAGIMVWVMIFMVIAVVACGIAHCSIKYVNLKDTPGSNITLQQLGFQPDFSLYLHIRQSWLAFIIILAILEVIIIILLIFLRKRIRIAVQLMKEASRAVGYVMSSLFYPIFTFLLLTIVIVYWGVTAVFLSTSSEPVYKVFNETDCPHARQTCDPENFTLSTMKRDCPRSECLFAFYGGETPYHKYLIILQFYNIFLFFWCANFVTALGQMTLAGAFASYYWAPNKPSDMPAYPLCASLGRSLRYHTGSLAFGSLILAIVQIIRVLLEYIDHKLKGAENKFAKFLLCCLKCCFWCLEKFIKFMNRNAYIMVAIYGKNFCRSARDAFFLLMRNVIRVVVLDKVTDFILFLGKLLIVGLVGIFAFFFFSGHTDAFKGATPSLHYYWVPILTVLVGSYLIAHGFFSVYAMCVDTLFLCFCEDLERSDGSAARPYHMTTELRDILMKDADAARTPTSRDETMQLTAPDKTMEN
ncbi:choline transporter-like protein 2 isoform X2 [Sinocyclocheilus anshuiensis]|uniref:choline transporter-like protein 2 isoform X2 n=1 Tax=Sinocyclocheilus anshuiensis TaxID=1608454 RepID=UPI0007BABC92|nr:PREDICTED: choline transporter-like protein 2 isoform X2 [Sinocyclocheilus anshuiensis]